jgi:hypothetical protein
MAKRVVREGVSGGAGTATGVGTTVGTVALGAAEGTAGAAAVTSGWRGLGVLSAAACLPVSQWSVWRVRLSASVHTAV